KQENPMALYEMRTYTLYVGKMAEAQKLYTELGFPALKKGECGGIPGLSSVRLDHGTDIDGGRGPDGLHRPRLGSGTHLRRHARLRLSEQNCSDAQTTG